MRDVIMGDYQNNRQLGKVFTNWFIYNFGNNDNRWGMLRTLNHAFRRGSKLAGGGALDGTGRRLHLGPVLPPHHLIRPRTVPAITDHLPIYQDKMYIFHENGFCSPAAL